MLGWWLMNRPAQIAGAIEEQHNAIKFEKMERIALVPEEVKKDKPKEKTIVKQAKKPQSDIQKQVQSIANEYGWGNGEQWEALSWIIQKESSWNNNAQNPTSTAYGLFQFLDKTWAGYKCTKTSDIEIQTKCGIKYIKARYKTPTNAVDFHIRKGWY